MGYLQGLSRMGNYEQAYELLTTIGYGYGYSGEAFVGHVDTENEARDWFFLAAPPTSSAYTHAYNMIFDKGASLERILSSEATSRVRSSRARVPGEAK